MQRLKEIIENFDQIELQDVDSLKQYAQQHPYSAIVQLAYAYFLHKQENYNFNTQLKLTAAVINSRTKLFNIIHGSNVAKVLKYHQAPVYVQEFDKIDDLRNEKNQNFEETIASKNKFQNSSEPLVDKSENYSEEKNQLNKPKKEDNLQILTNISEKDKEESTSVTHPNIQHVGKGEHASEKTEISDSTEIIESINKSEVKEKQNISENNLEVIREKIRAKFGHEKKENEKEDEKGKNVSDELKPVSEKSDHSLPEYNLNVEEKKIPLSENLNRGKEDSKSHEKDLLKEISPENESDNEKLREVKHRAFNILRKLEDLKSKYGTIVPKSNEDKRESAELNRPLEEQIPVNATNETDQNTSQNLEDEVQVVFDLTDTQIEGNTTIQDDSTTSEFTHLVEKINEDAVTVDNSEENQSYVQNESDKNTLYNSIDETKSSNNSLITPQEKGFEKENFYLYKEKDELSQSSSIDISDESNDEDDIFSKWLKTLHGTEEYSNKENNLQEKLSSQKPSEANSNSNTNKKIEKLKIIDNFLSGNIQIKPKSSNGKTSEEQKDLSVKYTETTPDLMTETLAELYIAQGHVDKAIQALEILKLKNPEKSSYFARRIQELKKKK